MMLTRTAAL